MASCVVALFLIGHVTHERNGPLDLGLTAWLVAGLTVVVGWMLIQAIPLSDAALSHPLRSRLGSGLNLAFGAISANPSASLTTVAQFAPPVVLAVVAASVGANRRSGDLLLKTIVLSATGLAVYGLGALYLGFDQVVLIDSDAYEGSLTATFVGRNSAATYLAIGLVGAGALFCEKMETQVGRGVGPHSLLEFFHSAISHAGIHIVIIAFLLSALLNTGSRAGATAGLVGFFVVGLTAWRPLSATGGRQVGMVVLIVGFLAGIAALSSTFVVERIETLDPAADARFSLYTDSLRMVMDRPLLGHGAGVFPDVYPMFQSAAIPASLVWNKAHSSYLQAAVELGLPILTVLLIVAAASLLQIGRCVVSRRESAPVAVAALGAFVVLALHSLVDFSLQTQAVGIAFAVIAGAGYGEATRVLTKSRRASAASTECDENEWTSNDCAAAESRNRSARRIVLGLLIGNTSVVLLTATRLAIVVSAVPSVLWLTEIYPLTSNAGPVSEETITRANFASRFIVDPALVTARLGPCREEIAAAYLRSNVDAIDKATEGCLNVVDAALAADPFSGELWLERSKLVVQRGGFAHDLAFSLRRAYETSPRVGWLAANRVVFGFKVFQFLPADVRESIRQDLDLVISEPRLADPLIASVVADDAIRRAVLPVVESLDPAKQQTFLGLVKDRIESGT